ncbi:MAG: FtsQ-type POTRA domain-containing protein [Fimbriimonadales bacterium]|nr:FtsQ-type POTRA domain-containing protein [Fimbriimonadales bacterium]MDW8052157.1 BamA/TamA family outer membrane protein [Armatimonadota bacterium]
MRILGAVVLGLLWGFATAQEVRSVQIQGATVAPPEVVGAPLYRLVGTTPSPETLQAALQQVEAWYRERGYTLARVVEYTLDESGVLKVQVAEGTIESVEVRGNKRTRTEVLRRLVGLRPGEVYNEQRIQRIRQRMARFPFLRDAKLSPEPSEQIGAAKLVLQVEEERSLDFAIAAGYTSDQGLIGYAEVVETNVAGLGHQLRVQWQREHVRNPLTNEYEALRPSYALSYEAPRALPYAFNFGIELYDRAPFYPVFYADFETVRRYERRRGATLYLGFDWRELFEVRLRYRNDRVDYDDAPNALLSPGERLANRGRFAAIGLQLLYDTREGRFPRSGVYANLIAERTVEGDFRFTRVLGEVRYHIPLRNEQNLMLRGVFGSGSDEMPLSERFWIGGYDLLRGYDLDEFRGTRMAVGSVEYQFPVLEAVQAALFVDVGAVWERDMLPERVPIRWGAGAGLRFASPIGLIRFDFAYGRRWFAYLSLASAY